MRSHPGSDSGSTHPSDEELLRLVHGLRAEKRRIDARMIAALRTVEDSGLHLRQACSSLYDFCKRRLHMSPAGASRRANAVRMVRRFPQLIGELEAERLTLSSLVLLDGHLTPENATSLLERVAGKTVDEVRLLLLDLSPRPDVPTTITSLDDTAPNDVAGAPSSSSSGRSDDVRPGMVGAPQRPRVRPLGKDRYALEMTISQELHDKLVRARDLMMHRHPSGDLAGLLEQAVDLLLAKIEKQRHAATDRPRTTPGTAKARGISAATRREVYKRDEFRCTFVSTSGHRCQATGYLELDHIQPRARGGGNGPENLRVRCHAHNQMGARDDFGAEHVAARIEERRSATRLAVAEGLRRSLMSEGFDGHTATAAARAVTEGERYRERSVHQLLHDAMEILGMSGSSG